LFCNNAYVAAQEAATPATKKATVWALSTNSDFLDIENTIKNIGMMIIVNEGKYDIPARKKKKPDINPNNALADGLLEKKLRKKKAALKSVKSRKSEL